jgi:predicted dehydrogenase
MIDIKNKHNGLVSVAHYRRKLMLFNEVKNMINSGVIGDVTLVRIETLQPKASKIITKTDDNWRVQPEISGGGFFHDLSPHQLDICYWLFGKPVKFRGNSVNQNKLYDAPDVVTVEAEFANGVLLQGIWAFNVNEKSEAEYCTIYGSKGHIGFSFFVNSALFLEVNDMPSRHIMHFPENIQQPMIDAVVKYFKGEGENPCSLEDALVVMGMIDSTVSR